MPPPKLKAPAEDGAILAVPPLEEWAELATRNAAHLKGQRLFSQPLAEWRIAARSAVEKLAERFHACNRLEKPRFGSGPWIVTGHQPELFHPGVWVKNLAAHALAGRLHGSSLNLIVDTDLVKTVALRVPDAKNGRTAAISFAAPEPPCPYEEKVRFDGNSLARLVSGAEPILDAAQSLLPRFRDEAVERAAAPSLGDCLAAARHRIEVEFGIANAEFDLSALCQSSSMGAFAARLFAELPRFLAIHNRVLAGYRTRHAVRGQDRPVPALLSEGGWLESPFWVWRAGESVRRRLFVTKASEGFRLAAGEESLEELPVRLPPPDHPDLAAAWAAVADSGWKIRSRALTTTMFARLFLADLFIHGLGGGLYDEMTDEIIRDFFGFEPPAYVILTGTLLLRDPDPPADAGGSPSALRRRLRDLHYNPDRFLGADASSNTLGLVAAKRERIARTPQSKPERFERFSRLHELNDQLRPKAERERAALAALLEAAEAAEARRRMYADREYAFILHEPERLKALFAEVARRLG